MDIQLLAPLEQPATRTIRTFMDASPLPEILIGVDPHEEPQLPLATEGVLRYVWKSKFGPILIEVKAGDAFVNGGRVEPLSETIQVLEWRSASPVAERA